MATTTATQQGDVALKQTPDGGDFNVENGIVEMCPGLEVAAYISLFGGNIEDDGSLNNPKQYWGNVIENEPVKQLRSRTQFLVKSLPLTSANLRRVEEAARNDLQWFLDGRIASELEVVATVPALNKLQIDIAINAYGIEQNFTFTENWGASV